ncbi:hypothetical protein [Streptomyces sp. CT34]|uniref:hypothetical protein n=1 Tax=Streptomyces sp. CT34 TaxID=1553907 RepID=UPI0012FF271B|nr:hypothetical protein [Streptomyces sp. CT34]
MLYIHLMCMYAPSRWRDVLVACFDGNHRVALLDHGPAHDGPPALPTTRRHAGESYAGAAARLLKGIVPEAEARLGDLVGRLEALRPYGALHEVRKPARLFTAHVDSSGIPRSPYRGAACLRWLAHPEVPCVIDYLGIPDLDHFLEGYVHGWLPEGWITLQ